MNQHVSTKKRKGFVLVLLAALGFLALLGTTLVMKPTLADDREGADEPARTRLVRLDVAENGKRFTPDETPVFPDGLPAYGNEFITEGYIYPSGTLNGTNGVNPDGTPEFPDRVIGRWYCRGWHVGDGAHTTTGPIVITHQLYDLGDRPGSKTITTDGIELADVNTPLQRAITGGTGKYSLARGEQTQTLLGFPNNAGGVNLRVEFRVAKN